MSILNDNDIDNCLILADNGMNNQTINGNYLVCPAGIEPASSKLKETFALLPLSYGQK